MVIKRKQPKDLAEISQSMGLKFSICERDGDNVVELIPPCKCRDFLGDVILSSLTGHDFSIYGMSWKGSEDKVSMDKARFSLYFPNKEARVNFEKNLHFLHDIELKNGIALTEYTYIEGENSYIEGASEWINFSALSYSLYTLLLRVFCYKINSEDWITEISNGNYSDSKYIKSFDKATLSAILDNLYLLNMPEWAGLSYTADGNSAVHHNSGIVSVCSTHSEVNIAVVKRNKHYLILKEKGFKLYI